MTRSLCACGCGRPVRPKKGPQGTAAKYAQKQCAVRVCYRRSLGEPIDDTPDLPPAGAPLMSDDELAELAGFGPSVGSRLSLRWWQLIVLALAEIRYWRTLHDQRGR